MNLKKSLEITENLLIKFNFISGLLIGGLSGFIFAPFFISAFTLCFALFLYRIIKATSLKEILIFAFAFGFGHFAVSLSWIMNAYFVFDNPGLNLIGIFVPIFFGLWGTLFTVPLAFITYKVKGKYVKWLTFTVLFGVLEWVRSWLFTGFPWNPLGSAFAFSDEIIQITSIIGVYGLSVFVIMFVSSFALLPDKFPVTVSFLILLSFFIFGYMRLKQNPTYFLENGPEVRIVQASISWQDKQDREKVLHEYISLSRKDDNNKKITHVIWPESAYPFWLEDDDFYRSFLIRAMNPDGTLITGADRKTTNENGKHSLYNSIMAVDDLGEIFVTYDKSHLVPFGEYVPFKDKLPFSLRKVADGFIDFSAGKGLETYEMYKAPPFAPLICFEAIFSGRVKNKDFHPSWFINVSNDAWYGHSAGPYQHLIASKLRAVEEGIPVFRAANNGISAVIDAYGRIVKYLPLDKKDYIDSKIPVSLLSLTFFGKYGNLVLFYITMVIIIITLVIHFYCIQKK